MSKITYTSLIKDREKIISNTLTTADLEELMVYLENMYVEDSFEKKLQRAINDALVAGIISDFSYQLPTKLTQRTLKSCCNAFNLKLDDLGTIKIVIKLGDDNTHIAPAEGVPEDTDYVFYLDLCTSELYLKQIQPSSINLFDTDVYKHIQTRTNMYLKQLVSGLFLNIKSIDYDTGKIEYELIG